MAAFASILLAGAAALPAMPIDQRAWFTSREHPKTALSVAERGAIAYTIDVAPDGVAIRCQAPGGAELGERVCEIVMKRARFSPATDDHGRAVHGVHEGVASFLMPGRSARPDPAKITMAADRLPAGVASPAYVKVAFLVDAAGAIGACAATAGEGRRSMQTVAALAPAACDHLAASYRAAPARDASGDPVASVQTMLIRFQAGPKG